MRTLLIDNYDSFTYNLYQYLAASNAQPPTVVRNDETTWAELENQHFDNIVISPGPGRPQRLTDLGISADALLHARVPILGVCLGHQAMGHFCGATVGLAVRPMHGRLDRVTHCATGLFRGIPNPFEAVRYHSLAVTDLPPELEPLAWTADGTLMGLQHMHKPWWGVQFHPESICTEYGARLLRNFRELTLEWRGRTAHRATSTRPIPSAPPRSPSPLSVHARCVDCVIDPEAAFMRFFADSDTAFWLDSSLADGERARFSYMGDTSGPHSKVVTYRSSTRQLHLRDGMTIASRTQSIVDYLKEQIPPHPPAGPSLPFEFAGGYVGYFGYELKGELDGDSAEDAVTPDAMWIMADRFLVFDHAEQQAWIVCLDESTLSEVNREWADAVERALSCGLPAARPVHPGSAASLAAMTWRKALPDYRGLVVRSQEEILQGETYEVCLTNQLVGKGRIEGLEVYRTLRRHNPAPYAAYLKAGDVSVLCASPELFLHIAPDRTVDSRPIKGTARRGATATEDQEIAAQLVEDEKTRAENLMIVDLLRNDLNRVCEVGSVHVPRLFELESYATVHQLVSTIRGRLRDDLTAIDCVRATFPGGSMTGAPKIRTMRILDGLEQAARGIYSGSIGFIGLNGSAKLNIVIRTIVCAGDQVSIGSGGAIVAMSDPDEEVKEIVLKARAQLEVLRRCGAPLAD